MKDVTPPIEPEFSYEVGWKEETYVVGVKNANFNHYPHIHGDVFRNRVIGKSYQTRRFLWWKNIEEKTSTERDFVLEQILISFADIDRFVQMINTQLKKQYSYTLPEDELRACFNHVFIYYKKIFDQS